MNENFNVKKFNPELELIKDTFLNFVIPLVVLVITIAAGVIIIYPIYKEIPVIKSEIEDKTNVKNQLSTKKDKLEQLVDFKSAIDENAGILSNLLESEPKVPELLNQIDIIAKQNGLVVTKLSYTVNNKIEENAVNNVEVSLTAESSYEQMVEFLKTIYDAARLINIDGVRFNFNENDLFYTVTYSLASPYLRIESEAVIEEPIELVISSERFTEFMNVAKQFKYYESNVPIFPIPLETEELVLDEEGNPVIVEGSTPADSPFAPSPGGTGTAPTVPPASVPSATTP